MTKKRQKELSKIAVKTESVGKGVELVKKAKSELLEVTATQKPVISQRQPILATGKRKTAIAQVKLFVSGRGQILVNNKNLEQYFPYFEWQKIVEEPLDITGQKGKCDIIIKLNGGGLRAQAEAARLGISRALTQSNPDIRKILKSQGLLTRDARIKERKKPGLKRARRAPQWQKR